MVKLIFSPFFRRRRNLLIFSETSFLYYLVILYFIIESGVFFLMYKIQDNIGPDYVFFIVHSLYGVFDLFFMVSAIHLTTNTIL